MKLGINAIGLAMLCLALGCGNQPYEDTHVWSASNAPSAYSGWIVVDSSPDTGGEISIKAESVRIDHLLKRLAQHQGHELDFVATRSNMMCTVNLTDVTLSHALESIADMDSLTVIQVNGRFVVVDKKGIPNNQIQDIGTNAPNPDLRRSQRETL
jgi:hypothetical protein